MYVDFCMKKKKKQHSNDFRIRKKIILKFTNKLAESAQLDPLAPAQLVTVESTTRQEHDLCPKKLPPLFPPPLWPPLPPLCLSNSSSDPKVEPIMTNKRMHLNLEINEKKFLLISII